MADNDTDDQKVSRLKMFGAHFRQNKKFFIFLAGGSCAALAIAFSHHGGTTSKISTISQAPTVVPKHGQLGKVSPNYADSVRRDDAHRLSSAKDDGDSYLPSLMANDRKEQKATSLANLDDMGQGPVERPASPDIPSIDDTPVARPVAATARPTAQETAQVVTAPPTEQEMQDQKDRIQKLLGMNKFEPTVMLASASGGTSSSGFGSSASRNTGSLGFQRGTSSTSGMGRMSAGSASLTAAGDSDESGLSFVEPSPGTVMSARLLGEVDSRAPGPVLAVVTDGPYSGSRVMGTFARGEDGLVLKFTGMTLIYEDDDGNDQSKYVTINAVAVSRDNLSSLMATSVNRHLLAKIGFQMATSFMQGLGQAIQQSGSTAMVSATGGTFISQGKKNTEQEMLQAAGTSAGQVGSTLRSMFGNEPTTIKVAKDTEFGLLFMGKAGQGQGQGQKKQG